MSFVHLHVHSHYSLLDGLSKIDDIIKFAKEDGSNAIALTDHGVLYGAIEFYQKALKAGVKPIIGIETYMAPDSRFNKTYVKGEKMNYHLILLAKNYEGYKNLIKITSEGHLNGYYYKPRIDWEYLKEHKEGLIASSACLGGEISSLLRRGKDEEAKRRAQEFRDLFGVDNYYLELQHHPDLPEQSLVNIKMIALARELGIGLVATNDSHYVNKDDDEAQDILLCLQNKAKKAETNRMSMLGGDYSLVPGRKMEEIFKDTPEAITNTVKIAEMCNVEIELGKIQLPHFAVPEGFDGNSYLRHLSEEGLIKRYGKSYQEIEPIYRERLDYELSVVEKMGWPSYFLIVADFVNWAKNNKIVVGPGRGSAAGSLICYAIGITNLCPLKYDLLFERFLNPDRISMPDIDMDFADIRRNDVLNYVQEKYGYDHVAQIVTFGTMAARAALRDVGRVLDYPYDFCDKLSKAVPMFTTLSKTIKEVVEFQELYKDPDAKIIVDYALKLEGVARHSSVHACGVLITKDPLTENVPVQYASTSDKTIVSQYSLHPIEDLGLLKMDFLGLKNLTIIESAIRIIKNTRGLELDMDTIPLDSLPAYELFQAGETTGVFQFECLSGDTIVSNTTIKKLYEKNNKEKLLSVYLNDGAVHKNKILKVVESGVKELYVLVAENNWQIKATKNHKFLTADGWKKLADLKIGDKILIKDKSKHLVYNTCQKCGKQISGQKEGKSDFCYHCSAEHYSNPSKPESRAKIQSARINFFQNGGEPWNVGLTVENSAVMKETGRKISATLSGRTFDDYYSPEVAQEKRRKMSERSSGENNPMFGKPCPHRKGGFREDLGHYVRSTWEADFARILKLHNLDYQYEPKTFELVRKNGEILHYTPDFYTATDNTFYEIKGWMHDLDQEKIDLFQEQYPEYKFVLISSTKFSEFALKYKQLIAWECPKIPANFHFVKIRKIEACGQEMTYDIAMQPPGNNFIANGFVVHNSSGMKRYLRDLKPNDLEDIIAMVALYRPGPMEWIPDYISGKHGRKLTYLHPKLEPILKTTYGVAIYQEQVMRMARDLAGFSMGEADVLRKAMGKKIAKLLEEQKQKFIDGCVKNGIDSKLATTIFSFIEPFAGYGFNRSHAACYAMVAYQTAYLKANWPAEFMAALLTSDQGDTDRMAIEIEECRNMGVEVKQPDINQSFDSFTVVTSGTTTHQTAKDDEVVNTIRFGLKAIKNVGEHIAEAIIAERKKNGPFADMSDFLERVGDKDLNKKSLESLIRSGAFDLFEDRGRLLANVEVMLNFHRALNKKDDTNQGSLFGTAIMTATRPKLNLVAEATVSNSDKLAWEKELLGLYVSEHPFNEYKKFLKGLIMPIGQLKTMTPGVDVKIAGVITTVKKILTKKNENMLFVKLEDGIDNVEVLIFPTLLKVNPEMWVGGQTVICSGSISDKDNDVKILANTAQALHLESLEADMNKFKGMVVAPKKSWNNNSYGNDNGHSHGYIKPPVVQPVVVATTPPLKLIIDQTNMTPEVTEELKTLCQAHPGDSKVFIKILIGAEYKIIEAGAKVNLEGDLVKSIEEKLTGLVKVV